MRALKGGGLCQCSDETPHCGAFGRSRYDYGAK